jgi:hypothetical protein
MKARQGDEILNQHRVAMLDVFGTPFLVDRTKIRRGKFSGGSVLAWACDNLVAGAGRLEFEMESSENSLY